MTGIFLFQGVGFCIAQKINNCTVFVVCYLEKKNSSRSRKWKKSEKIPEHEASQSHRDFFTAWKETERRYTLGVSIDVCIKEQTRDEKKRPNSQELSKNCQG